MDYGLAEEWEKYRDWLVERVGFRKKNYKKLMKILHNSTFFTYLERDRDRLEDGLYLREEYFYENLVPDYLFDNEDCSILEMLVAFSIRIDNEWTGDPGEEHPEIIFWEMIENLGLDSFSDRKFQEGSVRKILDVWIKRKFDSDGFGSIFPLKNPRRDQTKIEIWGQMQEYLSENY